MKSLLIFVSLLALSSAVPPAIIELAFYPLGEYQHKKYYLSQKLRTDWIGAYNFCKAHEMDLVSLDDGDEAENFFLILNNQARQFDTNAYVGGMTNLGGSKHLWFWVNTGKAVNFSMNWNKGEPNNGGILMKQELCLDVSIKNGQFGFNDISCYNNAFFQFICQSEYEDEEK